MTGFKMHRGTVRFDVTPDWARLAAVGESRRPRVIELRSAALRMIHESALSHFITGVTFTYGESCAIIVDAHVPQGEMDAFGMQAEELRVAMNRLAPDLARQVQDVEQYERHVGMTESA